MAVEISRSFFENESTTTVSEDGPPVQNKIQDKRYMNNKPLRAKQHNTDSPSRIKRKRKD